MMWSMMIMNMSLEIIKILNVIFFKIIFLVCLLVICVHNS